MPPARSTVTATTAPAGRGARACTATVPPPSNVPARRGRAVLRSPTPRRSCRPARSRGSRRRARPCRPAPTTTEPFAPCERHRLQRLPRVVELVREADVPDPEPDHEARGDRDRRDADEPCSDATTTGRRGRDSSTLSAGSSRHGVRAARRGRPRGSAPAAPAADRPAARRRRARPPSPRARPGLSWQVAQPARCSSYARTSASSSASSA